MKDLCFWLTWIPAFAGMTPQGTTILPHPAGCSARPQGMQFWLTFFAPSWAQPPDLG
jgi:hypothetical protein